MVAFRIFVPRDWRLLDLEDLGDEGALVVERVDAGEWSHRLVDDEIEGGKISKLLCRIGNLNRM